MSEPPPATGQEEPRQTAVKRGRPWLPVLIATILAAIVLAILLIPGVLLYPEPDTTAEDRQSMLTLQRENNRSLEERIATLQALSEEDICVAEDGFFKRGKDGKLEPFGPAEEALLPKSAGRQPVNKEEQPKDVSFEGNLVELLDLATVMVLAPKAGGQGTGFFVAPGLVVTNRHVIGGRPEPPLVILGKGLEKPLVAEIVAETVGNDFFTPDYALLKATGTGGLPYLALTDRAQKLQDVVAAGYPGLLTETDEDIQRLATGDMQSMPEPSVTSGVVTAKQSPRGVPLLVHTATISGGSSGGPLVDECGRVVGMNTFVRNSQKDGGRMNYALATPSLAAFLQQHQVPLTLNSQACVVQTQQAREDKEAAPEANEKTGTGGEEEPK